MVIFIARRIGLRPRAPAGPSFLSFGTIGTVAKPAVQPGKTQLYVA